MTFDPGLDPNASPPTYSDPLGYQLFPLWIDWQRGIPPSREWRGRSAQNPHLLRAFDAIDRAKARAEARTRPEATTNSTESSAAFNRRIDAAVRAKANA